MAHDCLISPFVLILISLYILYEAYERFKNPPEVESAAMLGVAAVGLVINIIGMYILRAGSKESLNMKGAYFEVLSDMLTSIGVIVAGVIMLTTGWYYADPIISAGIGLFILPRTWALLKDAVGVLIEGTFVLLPAVRTHCGDDRITGTRFQSVQSALNTLVLPFRRAPGLDHPLPATFQSLLRLVMLTHQSHGPRAQLTCYGERVVHDGGTQPVADGHGSHDAPA